MKIHMEDSKRIGDGRSSQRILAKSFMAISLCPAEISGVSQGVRPSQTDYIIRTNSSNCLMVLQVKCLKTGIF